MDLKLIVEGAITETGKYTPHAHLGPTQAPEEAYFALAISTARLTDGREQPPSSIVPAEFAGDIALLEQFRVGDRVRITATTPSGRLIEAMLKID